MDVTLTINGRDYSAWLSTYTPSLEVTYSKVITTLDNKEHRSPGVYRPTITFSLLPLSDFTASQLYDDLSAVPDVTFTNPYDSTGVTTRQMCVTSNLQAAFGLRSIDGNRYYKSGEITLRAV